MFSTFKLKLPAACYLVCSLFGMSVKGQQEEGPTATSEREQLATFCSGVGLLPSVHLFFPILVYVDKDSSPIKLPNRAVTISHLNCACKCTDCRLLLVLWKSKRVSLHNLGQIRNWLQLEKSQTLIRSLSVH